MVEGNRALPSFRRCEKKRVVGTFQIGARAGGPKKLFFLTRVEVVITTKVFFVLYIVFDHT